jgi:hypothetical protein
MYSHCTTGGWILGNSIDGTQAGFVRTPYVSFGVQFFDPVSRGIGVQNLNAD